MLGSDPVRQYDEGLGTDRQGVITLEPVYKFGGGDSDWVNWYFKQFVSGNAMATLKGLRGRARAPGYLWAGR